MDSTEERDMVAENIKKKKVFRMKWTEYAHTHAIYD